MSVQLINPLPWHSLHKIEEGDKKTLFFLFFANVLFAFLFLIDFLDIQASQVPCPQINERGLRYYTEQKTGRKFCHWQLLIIGQENWRGGANGARRGQAGWKFTFCTTFPFDLWSDRPNVDSTTGRFANHAFNCSCTNVRFLVFKFQLLQGANTDIVH